MIAQAIGFDEQVNETPVVVLWCEEQKNFTVAPVCDWVGNKMKSFSDVREVHLHPVGVFETAEQAFIFVQSYQKKTLCMQSV